MTLSTTSFFLTAFLGAMTVTSILAPFMTSSGNPVRFYLGGREMMLTGLQAARLLIPIGLIALSLLLGVLWGLGRLRLLLVEVLSGERKRQRLEQLTAEVGHLTASRATLMDAFEAERTRIERDLHDGTQQELVALAMNLGGLRLAAESLPEDDTASASRTALLEGIDTAQDRAESALKDLRETVRGIRPAVLSERGLAPALKDLAGRAPLPTSVVVEAEKADLARISQPVATVVYFAATEARHDHAALHEYRAERRRHRRRARRSRPGAGERHRPARHGAAGGVHRWSAEGQLPRGRRDASDDHRAADATVGRGGPGGRPDG